MGALADAATNPSTMETVTNAMTTGLQTIADSMGTAIGNIIPVALPVMGMLAVVGVGIRIFHRIAK